MKLNQNGIGIYKILTIIFLLALVTILYLPQLFDLNAREMTEKCIANMKEVKAAAEQYVREREDTRIGTTELVRAGLLKLSQEECPEGGIGDKYFLTIENIDDELVITVKCPNEHSFPTHTLVTID